MSKSQIYYPPMKKGNHTQQGYACQPYCFVHPDDGEWSCVMTFNNDSWAEGTPGEHMISTRTKDNGKRTAPCRNTMLISATPWSLDAAQQQSWGAVRWLVIARRADRDVHVQFVNSSSACLQARAGVILSPSNRTRTPAPTAPGTSTLYRLLMSY
eukprot:COSAG06_NODE_694_length_13019_cov_11.782043_7_plen_155_part_00